MHTLQKIILQKNHVIYLKKKDIIPILKKKDRKKWK